MESDEKNQPEPSPPGNSTADLFPQLYGELRRLASHRMAREKPGQTLQALELATPGAPHREE